MTFIPGWSLQTLASGDHLLIFINDQLVLHPAGVLHAADAWADINSWAGHQGQVILPPTFLGHWQAAGHLDAKAVFVVGLAQTDAAAAQASPVVPYWVQGELVSLRRYLLTSGLADWPMISTGMQLLHWWRDHRYCGRCGQPTSLGAKERTLVCPACAHVSYPRVSPCIITLICHDDQLLLARAPHFPPGVFSLIAGFVEAGESAEAAVVREVAEETGVSVTNLRYVASQSWPFPHQLMLGFIADYAGGELAIDPQELCEGGWFHRDALPDIPGPQTIAGQIIRLWLETTKQT